MSGKRTETRSSSMKTKIRFVNMFKLEEYYFLGCNAVSRGGRLLSFGGSISSETPVDFYRL